MCFICSQSRGFETDIDTIIELSKSSTIEVINEKKIVKNEIKNKSIMVSVEKSESAKEANISSDSFKEIDPKYLIMGIDNDGRDEIAIRKEYAGTNRQIKVYLSNGGDEMIDDSSDGKHQIFYSLKPEDWQRSYVIESLEKVNEFINIDLKLVSNKNEADYTIIISPLSDENNLSADPERGKSANILSISHNTGIYYSSPEDENLGIINHNEESKKVQKYTFVHELGHLLGLEHPFDLIDDDVIDPYYPENFSYLSSEKLFPYEYTIMGWSGSYVKDTNYKDIWFLESDIKSLEVIWNKSKIRSFSDKSYDYKFYNLGNEKYGIKSKDSTKIDSITGNHLLKFDDQNMNLINDIKGTFDQVTGLNTNSGKMFRLYNASFKRLPDPDGLRYWIANYSSGKDDERAVASSFLTSNEFKLRYGENISDSTYVNTLYKNVLGRDADTGGLNYWLGQLNSGGETRYEVLLGFSESAENKGLFTEMTGFD